LFLASLLDYPEDMFRRYPNCLRADSHILCPLRQLVTPLLLRPTELYMVAKWIICIVLALGDCRATAEWLNFR
jgi:hypothetical protein